MKALVTTKELIQSDIEVHGHTFAAKRYAKKMPFTLFHYFAFGYLPRCKLVTRAVNLMNKNYSITYTVMN